MARKKEQSMQEEMPHTKPEKTEYERDNEPVHGMFRYYEVPGSSFKFVYKKHDGPIEKYELQDGEVYTIPRCVAEHLNQECWYPVHDYLKDENGQPSMRIGKRVNRVGFHSLDFMEERPGLNAEPSPIVYPS